MTSNKFDGLKEKLLENKKWPLKYMFKFIAPNIEGKVDELKTLLPKHGQLSYKHTKNLKHVSITCVASMKSVGAIILVMENAMEIDGVMSL